MSRTEPRPFFWLHIEKSAGQSIRAALGDAYRRTDRANPAPFIALPRAEWNNNLNKNASRSAASGASRQPLARAYTRRTRALVESLYEADIEHLGYGL